MTTAGVMIKGLIPPLCFFVSYLSRVVHILSLRRWDRCSLRRISPSICFLFFFLSNEAFWTACCTKINHSRRKVRQFWTTYLGSMTQLIYEYNNHQSFLYFFSNGGQTLYYTNLHVLMVPFRYVNYRASSKLFSR